MGSISGIDLIATIKTILYTVFAASVIAIGILYTCQSKLIYPSYFPYGARTQVDTPDKYGLAYELVELNTLDNITLSNYLIIQDRNIAAKRPTLLLLHGNAGNIGHRLPIAYNLFTHPSIQANIFMLSYRGYGKSTGFPSEKGFEIDSQCALDYLKSHSILKNSPIFAYGTSIGGAVTIKLVSQNDGALNGSILENTFTSLAEMIPVAIPIARKFTWLCHQHWPSRKTIAMIKSTPLLFISGEKDEVVPPQHMHWLFEAATVASNFKEFYSIKDGLHNDTCMRSEFYDHLAKFISKYACIQTRPI